MTITIELWFYWARMAIVTLFTIMTLPVFYILCIEIKMYIKQRDWKSTTICILIFLMVGIMTSATYIILFNFHTFALKLLS